METKVILYSTELGEHRSHTIGHAQKLLSRKGHTWALKDKDFIQNENGIIVRRSKQANSKTEQSGPA